MIPAGTDREHTTFDKMARRYKVDRTTPASRWSQEEGFPAPLFTSGQGGAFVFDEEEVDEWVRENHLGAWLRSREGKKNALDLPSGGPRDLLTLRRIGELEGRALGREATPVATLRTYMSPSKGILPPPDRTPGDGLEPVVTEPMWFRETAYNFINRPRRVRRASGRAQGKSEQPRAQRATGEPLLDLELPEGDDSDLLTLEQIAQIDGAARGRARPTSVATLRVYMSPSKGILSPPDRTPRDGQEPEVTEPMWRRETAYRFIRRPGRVGGRARATAEQPREEELLDLRLPGGEDSDLLTLEEIGKLDGKARGRGKATTISTLRTYLYGGLLAQPDRTPGDGQEPEVTEPMWRRETAYRFIRRPGQLGRARR
jgi:hypothetical protein